MSPTPLEEHLDGILKIFHQYSTQSGHCDALDAKGFAQLMHNQLPHFLKKQGNCNTCEKLFKEIDENKDLLLSLDEFLNLVVRVLTSRNVDRTLHQH